MAIFDGLRGSWHLLWFVLLKAVVRKMTKFVAQHGGTNPRDVVKTKEKKS